MDLILTLQGVAYPYCKSAVICLLFLVHRQLFKLPLKSLAIALQVLKTFLFSPFMYNKKRPLG